MRGDQVTIVRHARPEAWALLRAFIFGGKLGPGIVPHGVATADVEEFILAELTVTSSVDAYRKTVDVMRFYECGEVLGHLRLVLTGTETDPVALQRSAAVLQATGDFGTPAETAAAAAYLDNSLLPLDAATDYFPELLLTRVALAPAGSWTAIESRIAGEVARTERMEQDSEAAMMTFDKVLAVQQNDLAAARSDASWKANTMQQGVPDRRESWARTYLGYGDTAGSAIETWAARQLRLEALRGRPDPVIDVFAAAITAARETSRPASETHFITVRAAQAIRYLTVTVAGRPFTALDDISDDVTSFLWDGS